MLRLAGAIGIPEHLRVEMRVMIDEAGRNGQPVGIDGARGASFQAPDFGDLTVFHADVGDIGRQPRTVNDAATTNEQIIIHCESSFLLGACIFSIANVLLADPYLSQLTK